MKRTAEEIIIGDALEKALGRSLHFGEDTEAASLWDNSGRGRIEDFIKTYECTRRVKGDNERMCRVLNLLEEVNEISSRKSNYISSLERQVAELQNQLKNNK